MPDFSRVSEYAANLGDKVSGLKDKLTGREDPQYDQGYDEYGYDEYGEYDAYEDYNDYGEYGYDPDNDPMVTTRSTRRGYSSNPALVSFDDVRANTSASDRLRYEQAAPAPRQRSTASASSSASANRASQDTSPFEPVQMPAMPSYLESDVAVPSSSPSRSAVGSAPVSRSKGYDSLFTPSEGASGSSTQASTSGYDPYATYSGTGAASHTPTRSLKVIKPINYGDVESVSRALKAGDAVVLVLTSTASDLSKRVLDFSFGVASALDARVDCVADKVFVIARGSGLSADERAKLQAQGVL